MNKEERRLRGETTRNKNMGNTKTRLGTSWNATLEATKADGPGWRRCGWRKKKLSEREEAGDAGVVNYMRQLADSTPRIVLELRTRLFPHFLVVTRETHALDAFWPSQHP
jgi:hypothetical protein